MSGSSLPPNTIGHGQVLPPNTIGHGYLPPNAIGHGRVMGFPFRFGCFKFVFVGKNED